MEHFDDVDAYLAAAERWPDEIRAVRSILLDCGLDERVKWGKPCYTHEGANIAIVQEMKDFLALMFFKGELLDDPAGLLQPVGPNSRSARRACHTSVDEIRRSADALRALVRSAVEVEVAGVTIEPAPEPQLVAELQARLDDDPALAEAFAALTPGRRREYHLHVSGAKQARTRESRVDRCVPNIMAGKGLRDR